MTNMKHSFLALGTVVAIVMSGCQNEPPSPQPMSEQTEIQEQTIELYGQMLSLTDDLYAQVFPKEYGRMKNIQDGATIQGEVKNRTFIFDSKSRPYYLFKFDRPMTVKAIKIYNTGRYVAAGKKSGVLGLVSLALDGNLVTERPSYIQVAFKEDKELEVFKTEFKEKDPLKEESFETIVLHKPRTSTELHVAISAITHPLGTYMNSHLSEEYSFDIDAYDPSAVDAVVLYNLRLRNDTEANEALIRQVAIESPKLFRKIQRSSHDLKLANISLAKLPEDVQIKYALNNYATILRTGRYIDTRGKAKKFKVADIDFTGNDSTYRDAHKVEVNGKNVAIHKSSENIQPAADFIDFSEGL